MAHENDEGGFGTVRESAEGHPMANLLRYALPYWPRLTGGIVSSILTRLARLVPPVIVAVALDRVILGSGQPGLLAQLGLVPATPIPPDATAMRIQLLEHLVLLAAAAYAIRSLSRFVSRYLLQSTAQKIQRDLRNDAYDHIQRLSMDFYANHQTGGMMAILNSDINRLEQFLNTELRQIVRMVATVVGIGALMFWTAPKLAVIALAPVPIVGLTSAGFLIWIAPKYRRIRETVARLNSRLENNLGGVRVIKSFNRYDFEFGRVATQSQAYHDEKVDVIRIRRAFFASLRLLTGVVFVLLLYVGGIDFINGTTALTTGTFAMFFLLIRRLYSPMRRIGQTANKYTLAKSSAERVFGLLGHEPTITSPSDAHVPASIEGRVSFDDVTFSYDGQGSVLRDVSFDVEPGKTVGIAGPTGAGKSTLLKLIPRFYDVDEGAIRVDGVDVREYDLRALRAGVGIVEQDPYLFSGTAAENIAYGDLSTLSGGSATERPFAGDEAAFTGDENDARISPAYGVDERIVEAAKAAEAHEFIVDLPDGYHTQVGERGVKLSGGQRQRISIARALLNDPAIVVLDEATSDVDTETEESIQENLARLTADRTAFVIAHRLSTIRDADRIIVLEDGRIAEEGTHADLLATGGTYADLWISQSDAGDEASRPPLADDD